MRKLVIATLITFIKSNEDNSFTFLVTDLNIDVMINKYFKYYYSYLLNFLFRLNDITINYVINLPSANTDANSDKISLE